MEVSRSMITMYFVLYTFLILGLISTTGTSYDLLVNTEYGISNYWPLNFNDFPSAFITMFVLLQVVRLCLM